MKPLTVRRLLERRLLNCVELDAAALRWNLGQFRPRLEPGARRGAVVKANAYGHGMNQVAELTRDGGADWLCANDVVEAVELRSAGHDAPILVMGYVPLEALEAVVDHVGESRRPDSIGAPGVMPATSTMQVANSIK